MCCCRPGTPNQLLVSFGSLTWQNAGGSRDAIRNRVMKIQVSKCLELMVKQMLLLKQPKEEKKWKKALKTENNIRTQTDQCYFWFSIFTTWKVLSDAGWVSWFKKTASWMLTVWSSFPSLISEPEAFEVEPQTYLHTQMRPPAEEHVAMARFCDWLDNVLLNAPSIPDLLIDQLTANATG